MGRLTALSTSKDTSKPVTASPLAVVSGWLYCENDSNEFSDILSDTRILIADTPAYAEGTRSVVLYAAGHMLRMNVYSGGGLGNQSVYSLDAVVESVSVAQLERALRKYGVKKLLSFGAAGWLFGGRLPRH